MNIKRRVTFGGREGPSILACKVLLFCVLFDSLCFVRIHQATYSFVFSGFLFYLQSKGKRQRARGRQCISESHR